MRSIKCVVIGDGAVGKTSLLISYTTNTFPTDYVPTVFDNYTTTLALAAPMPLSSHSTSTSSMTGSSSVLVDHNTPVFKQSNSSRRKPLTEGDTLSSSASSFSTGADSGSGALKRQIFKLNLWDTAGQEEYDRLRPLSYRQTDVFLICFSVSEPSSFRNVVDKWFPELKRVSGIESGDLYTNFKKYPILLVGTKSDLRDDENEIQKMRDQNLSFVSKEEIDKVVEDNGFMGYVECSTATQNNVRQVFEKAVHIVAFEPDKLQRAKCVDEARKMSIQEDSLVQEESPAAEPKKSAHPQKQSHPQSQLQSQISVPKPHKLSSVSEKPTHEKRKASPISPESSPSQETSIGKSSGSRSDMEKSKQSVKSEIRQTKKKLKKKSVKCVII